ISAGKDVDGSIRLRPAQVVHHVIEVILRGTVVRTVQRSTRAVPRKISGGVSRNPKLVGELCSCGCSHRAEQQRDGDRLDEYCFSHRFISASIVKKSERLSRPHGYLAATSVIPERQPATFSFPAEANSEGVMQFSDLN